MNKRKIREDIWYHVEFEVSFFQRNQKAAEIFLKGKSIQEKLFDNPRIDKFNYGFIPRFKPDDDSSGMLYIRDQDNNEFKCKIDDISYKGFQLYSEHEFVYTQKNAVYEFYAFFKDSGVIHGKCVLRWIKAEEGENAWSVGFTVNDDAMSDNDKKNLDLAIKKYCKIHKQRVFIETVEKNDPV